MGAQYQLLIPLREGHELVGVLEVQRGVRGRPQSPPEQVILGEEDGCLMLDELGVVRVLQLPGRRRRAEDDAALPRRLPQRHALDGWRLRCRLVLEAGGYSRATGFSIRGNTGSTEKSRTPVE